MANIQQKIFDNLPHLLQNTLISLYNLKAYYYRYGGKYKFFREILNKNQHLTLDELKELQLKELKDFLIYAKTNSAYYQESLRDIDVNSFNGVTDLELLPILQKEDVRKNLSKITTIQPNDAIIAKTGGTTGVSLTTYFIKDDIQKRFAFVDHARGRFGYSLGKKVAWFSGKKILNEKDLAKNRFWKIDFIHNVKYYSTFHINRNTAKFYLENLAKFKPEYFVGFPSNMYELAKFGLSMGIIFPDSLKAIFTNAETLTDDMRSAITIFFKAKVYDQYGSAEGAPFIFECIKGNYHLELQSGVFEVLDHNGSSGAEGSLVVTSFATHGTPLIRYDIGDRVKLSDKICICGNNNPLVDKLLGRENDYLYSKKTGKINAGNLSNCSKGLSGIIKFQATQNQINSIVVDLIVDKSNYNINTENGFLNELRNRLGDEMIIELKYVEDIPKEKSGKFRIIKNNIKDHIDSIL